MKLDNSASVVQDLDPTANYSKQQDIITSTKQGHWSEEEHQLYVDFLLQVKRSGDSQKKGQPLFKRMSSVIGTRTPSQCRSHHQKFNPFNPRLRRHHQKHRVTNLGQPVLRSKQIMRKYFATMKIDSEKESQKE